MKNLIQKQQERFDEQFIREDGLLDIGKYDEDKIKSLMLQNAREIYEDLEREITKDIGDEMPLDSNESRSAFCAGADYVLQIIKTKKDENS